MKPPTLLSNHKVGSAMALLSGALIGLYLAVSAPAGLTLVQLGWLPLCMAGVYLVHQRVTAPRCAHSAWAWLAGALLLAGFIPIYGLAADHAALAPYVRWFVIVVAGLSVWAWHRWPTVEAFLRRQEPHATRWLWGGIICYGLATVALAAYRWRILTLGHVDSAIVIQSLRYTLDHGRLLFNTLEKVSHLGVHSSPIYVLLAPLYGLCRRPDWFLILLPAGAIALSAWPLYRLVERRLGPLPALLLTAAYLLYPPIMARSIGDFYEMTLCPVLLLATMDYYERERLGGFLLFGVLCLGVKESIAATFIMLSCYGWITRRRTWQRWLPAVLGLASLYVSYGLLLPTYGGDAVSSRTAALLGSLGSTPGEAIRFALSQPLAFARTVLTLPRLALFYQLFQGLLFLLPWLGPEIVLALPAMAINLLAQGGSIGIRAWESAILGPLLFLSAASGIAWLSQRLAQRWTLDRTRTQTILAFAVFSATLVCTPYWLRVEDYRPAPNLAAQQAAMALIPADAAVSAPDYMMAHLAERDILQLQTGEPFWATYQIVDLRWIEAMRGHRIPDAAARQYEALIAATEAGQHDANLERIWAQDGIYVFQNTER